MKSSSELAFCTRNKPRHIVYFSRESSALVSFPLVNTRNTNRFFFHGPIKSDDQPPVPHIVSIFSIQRDLVIRPVLSDIYFVMLLLYEVFGLPRLRFPLTFPWITHFTSSHPPSLMVCPKKERLRRTTNPRSCLV